MSKVDSWIVKWKKTLWTNVSFQRKDTRARYDFVMKTMRKDPEIFFWFHRLITDQFDSLLDCITPHLQTEELAPALSLSLALRYLSQADGSEFFLDLVEVRHITESFILEVLRTIRNVLLPDVIPKLSHSYLTSLIEDFEKLWNFPNCVSVMDGREILCQLIADDSSSMIAHHFLVHSDAYFRFISLPHDRETDRIQCNNTGCICTVVAKFDWKPFLPIVDEKLGTLIHPVGSSLRLFLRTKYEDNVPISERVFTYRYHRAFNAVGTALGILFERWQIFKSPIFGYTIKMKSILECAIVIHNWLINIEKNLPALQRWYMPRELLHENDKYGNLLEGHWWKHSVTPGVKLLPQRCGNLPPEPQRILECKEKLIRYFVLTNVTQRQWEMLDMETWKEHCRNWNMIQHDPRWICSDCRTGGQSQCRYPGKFISLITGAVTGTLGPADHQLNETTQVAEEPLPQASNALYERAGSSADTLNSSLHGSSAAVQKKKKKKKKSKRKGKPAEHDQLVDATSKLAVQDLPKISTSGQTQSDLVLSSDDNDQ